MSNLLFLKEIVGSFSFRNVAVHRHICVHGSANTTLVLFIVQSGSVA